jgi:CRISPR-associated exonuclease Cas4
VSAGGAGEQEGAGPLIPLRVNDLKQFAYCERIVFYQYAMPVQRKATFKMEHGKRVEPRIEQLEHRRTLRAYGLSEGRRQFQVWLSSSRLGLSGRLDLLITTPHGAFPVDFKDTREPVRYNHRLQLCAYALLVEDTLGEPVQTGFIYRVPREDVVVVEISAALREETGACVRAIRGMIAGECMPPPTPVRGRCVDCEYRNYCGDVF